MQHLVLALIPEQDGLWNQYDLGIVYLITTKYRGNLFAWILSTPNYFMVTLHNALSIVH